MGGGGGGGGGGNQKLMFINCANANLNYTEM